MAVFDVYLSSLARLSPSLSLAHAPYTCAHMPLDRDRRQGQAGDRQGQGQGLHARTHDILQERKGGREGQAGRQGGRGRQGAGMTMSPFSSISHAHCLSPCLPPAKTGKKLGDAGVERSDRFADHACDA